MVKNKINNKKYIGQTTRGFNNRYYEYVKHAKSCNPYLLKAFNKYGFENFEFNTIDTAKTIDELNYKEIRHILFHDTANRNFGYNIEFGGTNSRSSSETIEKLSKIRKEVKQTQEWIDSRLKSVNKPVLKINVITDTIIERYDSLADAGRKNNDNLSYQAILRICLGISKQTNDTMWCYDVDYINKKIPHYIKVNTLGVECHDKDVIEKIIEEYKSGLFSIRYLSKKHAINYSTLNTILKKNIRKHSIFNSNCGYNVICKKTNKIFIDFLNKSGILTEHVLRTYPNIILDSKFKRKQIEIKTGVPWYYKYFDFEETY